MTILFIYYKSSITIVMHKRATVPSIFQISIYENTKLGKLRTYKL